MEKYGNSLMEYELNLNKILRLIKENMISIVLWMGIGIFAALIAIFFIVTPKYSATTDLLVNQKSDNQQTQYIRLIVALKPYSFKNGNKSLMPRYPSCWAVYSAARMAPNTKPPRFLASCVMEMLSTSDS